MLLIVPTLLITRVASAILESVSSGTTGSLEVGLPLEAWIERSSEAAS